MANSRWGRATQNNIGSTQQRPAAQPGVRAKSNTPSAIRTKTIGTGPYIVDVRYDNDTKSVVIVKGDFNADAIDGPRIGKVMSPVAVSSQTSLPAVPSWLVSDGGTGIDWAQSCLLPDDFIHADGFDPSSAPVSNLPSGIGFVRLMPGSSPLGTIRWDADALQFGVITAAPASERVRLVRAVILDRGDEESDPNQGKAIIQLYFSFACTFKYNKYGWLTRKRIHVTSSRNARFGVRTVEEGDTANSIIISLTRAVQRDEDLYVQTDDGLMKDDNDNTNVASDIVAVNERLDRNCYALVLNRTSTAEYAVNDLVQIGKPVFIYDSNGMAVPVFDTVPYGQGGGVELYYGMVLGGNAPYAGAPTNLFLNSVPLYSEDLSSLVVVPEVVDWTEYDLDDEWAVEDGFANSTPLGLGYVQLVRPSSWGGKSWTSSYGLPINPGTWELTDPPALIHASFVPGDSFLQLSWSHGAMAVTPAQLASMFSISATPTLALVSATATGNLVTLTVDTPLTSDMVISISVVAGAWATQTTPAVTNAPQTIAAVVSAPVGAVVMAISKVSLQSCAQGDLVVMADLGTTITDEQDPPVTRSVLDIIMVINPHRLPHSHQGYGAGPFGGGPANLNLAGPQTYQSVQP